MDKWTVTDGQRTECTDGQKQINRRQDGQMDRNRSTENKWKESRMDRWTVTSNNRKHDVTTNQFHVDFKWTS